MTDEKKRTEALRIQFEYEKNGIKHLDPIEMFVGGCDFAIAENSKDIATAKEIIKEYYDLVEVLLIHHKIDTEKSVKLEVKAQKFLNIKD